MIPVIITLLICLTTVTIVVLVIKAHKEATTPAVVVNPLDHPELQKSIKSLQAELDTIKSKMSGIEVSRGFKKMGG